MKRNNLIHLFVAILLITSCDAVINSTEDKVKRIAEEGYDGTIEEVFGLESTPSESAKDVDFSSAKSVTARELFGILPATFRFNGLEREYKRNSELNHIYQDDSPLIEIPYNPIGDIDEDFMHPSTLTISILDGAKQPDAFRQAVTNIDKDLDYREGASSIQNVNKKGYRIQENVVGDDRPGVSLSYVKQNRYVINIVGQNTLKLGHLYEYLEALEKISFPK